MAAEKVKVKVERAFRLDGETIPVGKTLEVEPALARELIQSQKATPVVDKPKAERATRDGGETR